MNFVEITYQNIKFEIEKFLKIEHNKAGILFSPASPYGQRSEERRVGKEC
jgi:hypothetical protein